MGVTDYGTIATRLLIAFVIPLALAGCVSGEDENQETKKIAEKVKRQAELSEKAEGSQDLVKDEVTVRKGEKGQPIIEHIGSLTGVLGELELNACSVSDRATSLAPQGANNAERTRTKRQPAARSPSSA